MLGTWKLVGFECSGRDCERFLLGWLIEGEGACQRLELGREMEQGIVKLEILGNRMARLQK